MTQDINNYALKIEGRNPAKETLRKFEVVENKQTELTISMVKISEKLDHVCNEQKDIKDILTIIQKNQKDFIEKADSKYAFKDEFVFWRQILVSGILIAILIGIISLLLSHFFK